MSTRKQTLIPQASIHGISEHVATDPISYLRTNRRSGRSLCSYFERIGGHDWEFLYEFEVSCVLEHEDIEADTTLE